MTTTLGSHARWKSELTLAGGCDQSPSFAGEGMKDHDTLDAALLKAHADGNHRALVDLYTKAADLVTVSGDTQAMCFYLTQAYVFALETGASEADTLHERLKAEGREE